MRQPSTTAFRSAPRLLAAACLLALAAAPAALATEYERPVDRSFSRGALSSVELENLAGRVEIVGVAGDTVRVTGTVHADASAGDSARELGESLRIEFDDAGGRLTVRAVYPTGEHRRYHYPGSKRHDGDEHWLFDWLGDWNTSTRYQGRDVRVSGDASRGAATLWADFRLEVPAGLEVRAKNAVGEIDSRGVAGDQNLDTSSGPIVSRNSKGALTADTGSGDVIVEDHAGDVDADTGSGDVRLTRVRGERLAADTGSGDVELVDCSGSLDADTGSGDVTARGFVAGRSVRADTGSGDVHLEGDLAHVTHLDIDTGSGDVVMKLTGAQPSLRLAISTGSGDIDLDLADVRMRRARRGDYLVELAGGSGDGLIDTGSGDVRVTAR